MPEPAALLARLDAAIRELEAIRGEIAAIQPAPAAEGNGYDAHDDFAEHNLASVQAASDRWNVPQDTLRFWCRTEAGLGIRAGNVWRVSVPALRRRLERRGECTISR